MEVNESAGSKQETNWNETVIILKVDLYTYKMTSLESDQDEIERLRVCCVQTPPEWLLIRSN